jgi:hypothetical protein
MTSLTERKMRKRNKDENGERLKKKQNAKRDKDENGQIKKKKK